MNRRTFTLGMVSLALIGGGSWLTFRGQDQGVLAGAALAEGTADAPILPDWPLGSADAKVTLVEYASYTCPHCAHFHLDVFPALKRDYIDTGKVRFIHREVYFDKFGLWAGLLARCGGEMRYHGISGMIYDTQKDWVGDGNPDTIGANLRKLGAKAGLAPDQVEACLNDAATAKAMIATYQKNAGADGVNATPTLFINGAKHSNMSYDELRVKLDEALGG